jgi:hypothetical protein
MSLSARKYKHISAAEYLAADAMELELIRQRTDWQREFHQLDNTATFESAGLTLNVSQLCCDIDFEDPTLSSGT